MCKVSSVISRWVCILHLLVGLTSSYVDRFSNIQSLVGRLASRDSSHHGFAFFPSSPSLKAHRPSYVTMWSLFERFSSSN